MSKQRMPVYIYTMRDGEPYVLFGTHYDDAGDYKGYRIEDGPHIETLRAVFQAMENNGVIVTTPNTDIN